MLLVVLVCYVKYDYFVKQLLTVLYLYLNFISPQLHFVVKTTYLITA